MFIQNRVVSRNTCLLYGWRIIFGRSIHNKYLKEVSYIIDQKLIMLMCQRI